MEARKGREFLHSLKKTGGSPSNVNLVPNLEHLRRALDRWKRQYHHHQSKYPFELLRPHADDSTLEPDANPFLSACLDMEFYYITMYCFAPAAQALQSTPRGDTREVLKTVSEFANQAAQASHALLLCVVSDVLEPAKLIAYLPVRCWLFIVAASLHLLKVHTYFLHIFNSPLTHHRQPWQRISTSHKHIQTSAFFAPSSKPSGTGSPDDSHMTMRFSKFLGIMIQVSLPVASATRGEETGAQRLDGIQAVSSLEEEEAFASPLDDVGAWEIPLNLDVISDPVTWWDSFYLMSRV